MWVMEGVVAVEVALLTFLNHNRPQVHFAAAAYRVALIIPSLSELGRVVSEHLTVSENELFGARVPFSFSTASALLLQACMLVRCSRPPQRVPLRPPRCPPRHQVGTAPEDTGRRWLRVLTVIPSVKKT